MSSFLRSCKIFNCIVLFFKPRIGWSAAACKTKDKAGQEEPLSKANIVTKGCCEQAKMTCGVHPIPNSVPAYYCVDWNAKSTTGPNHDWEENMDSIPITQCCEKAPGGSEVLHIFVPEAMKSTETCK